MGINILQFSLGTILLYFGADYLILGSKSIASKFKIPPIVVGITLVAFGTSLPELIVSIIAFLILRLSLVRFFHGTDKSQSK